MTQDRDERPLWEIHFALDLPEPARSQAALRVRQLLSGAGAAIGQDIIELGCTGLVLNIRLDGGYGNTDSTVLEAACFIRKHMSGSVCGLPCYVPGDRFCLVHDTIGGLQLAGNMDGPQTLRHPKALPLMSRELTEDERKKVGGVNAKLNADAQVVALKEYGAQDIFEDDDSDATPAPSCPIPQPPFKCPNHKEPDWVCRKCIAQAIAEGNQTISDVEIRALLQGQPPLSFGTLESGLDELDRGRVDGIQLWVRVASWSKKVTRD